MRAETWSLDGEWQFAIDSTGSFSHHSIDNISGWRKIQVPLAWQVQFKDLRDYQGIAWYKKNITIDRLSKNKSVIIEFKAVDYLAYLYINGKIVGQHEGGYTPFKFDITDYLSEGKNTILLRVVDPVDSKKGTEGISYWHIPHGKQNWYVQSSGIWQSVFIHFKNRHHIQKIYVNSEINGNYQLKIRLNRKLNRNQKLHLQILDSDSKKVVQKAYSIKARDSILQLKGNLANPQLWHPQHPNLYTVKANLDNGDTVKTRFGFRRFEVKNGKFYLNKKPIYLIGALDQDFYPETNYTTPSEDYIRNEFKTARKLGLNLLRCHIKIPDESYLKIADEEGLLIWTEIPNWDIFNTKAARRASQTFDAMLDRDWNHPSLVIISIINESWGIDLKKEKQRKWLKQEFNRSKRKAPNRIIVDNSACYGNFHLKTEINDYHTYWAIPENRENFDKTIKDLASRPDWLFSSFGDAEETENEAMMLSEFGNWGLPQLPKKVPWWFKRDFLGREVTLPKNVRKRFDNYGYDKIFKNYNDLALESQKAQFSALKYEIESIRKESKIQGYVITEFTDINWECNGLLDMWRNPKIDPDEFSKLQSQDVLIPRPERYTYWEEDSIRIDITFSWYSDISLKGSRLYWEDSMGERGKISIEGIKSEFVSQIGSLKVEAPKIDKPQKLEYKFQLRNNQNKIVSENWCEVFLFPELELKTNTINLYDPVKKMEGLKSAMINQGYDFSSKKSENQIILTNRLDSTLIDRIKNGKKGLILVTDSLSMGKLFPYNIISRKSEWYDGNWASNFNWINNNHPIFKDYAFERHLGFEAAYASPEFVVSGIPENNFSDVLAGMYVGWLHLNSGYIVQIKVGQGTMLICTLNLLEQYGKDPFSISLLNRMLTYLQNGNANPTLEWEF
ncbi:MAG: hypothetical protein K9N00_00660 [Candidatus Marinimicrobia bacterium]|nr:hypothetical protein [Candidatus Neomarinimicrobiota bacterium]